MLNAPANLGCVASNSFCDCDQADNDVLADQEHLELPKPSFWWVTYKFSTYIYIYMCVYL